ncbi:acetyltransferase YjgM [Klebsiella michiganensis]|nr:acetyltransferase YjgM [Klebsiella michiganensis]
MNTSATLPLTLRRITANDNPAIAAVIRQVSAEYGLTADKGYTVADPNLDELYELYSQPGSAYWVVSRMVKWWAVAAWHRSPAASPISANYKKCIL